jgi:CPA2 family monovalent cation:H+ antiporter-2
LRRLSHEEQTSVEHGGLVVDIGIAISVAFAGGVIARWLRLPIIVGYVVAGIVVGPSTPGFDADIEGVRVLADLGVAFLMFSLGVEFSLRELQAVRRVAVSGGIVQLLVTGAFGGLLAVTLGWDAAGAILFGMIVAVSSSIVALKLLLLRGETGSRHGRIAIGLAVVQDLSIVPMFLLLPVLATEGGFDPIELLRSLGVAVALLIGVVVIGGRLVPVLLYRIAATASRELFVLAVLAIALGTALLTEAAGLSLALGAFLAGIVVSESDFSHQAVAEMIPLREAFATLFFVSIGMLLEPDYLTAHYLTIFALIVAVVAGKSLILAGILHLLRVPAGSAVLAGMVLAQIGEFSFIIASEGFDRDILGANHYSLVLAVSIGTILLSALLYGAGPRLAILAERLFPARADLALAALENDDLLARHAIVCGYGRIGAELVTTLRRRGFPCLVIDGDPILVRRARDDGVLAVYGDAGNPEVLHRVGIERARVLAVAISDPAGAEAAVRIGRERNPRLRIVARSVNWEQLHRLREMGADEVVQPEFEAGLELMRYVVQSFGVDQRQAGAMVQHRRESYYEREPSG